MPSKSFADDVFRYQPFEDNLETPHCTGAQKFHYRPIPPGFEELKSKILGKDISIQNRRREDDYHSEDYKARYPELLLPYANESATDKELKARRYNDYLVEKELQETSHDAHDEALCRNSIGALHVW